MRRLGHGLVLLVAVGGALTACTPGTGAGSAASRVELDRSPVTATTRPTAGAPSASTSTTPAPATRTARTSSRPSLPEPATVRTSTTAAPRSTCRSVGVRVIRGSADRGREFAALQFTNTGSTRCTLAGYPTVTLRLGGTAIGTPSQPDGSADSRYDLAPGDTAESRLDDYTDCQAPLSDAIHVVVPGSAQSATRPGQLRACTLRVSRLGHPD